MARRGYYLGKVVTGDYEVGRDPSAFHKGRGFPYKQLVTTLKAHFVEKVWKIDWMKPGDVAKIGHRRAFCVYARPLTAAEKEKYYG